MGDNSTDEERTGEPPPGAQAPQAANNNTIQVVGSERAATHVHIGAGIPPPQAPTSRFGLAATTLSILVGVIGLVITSVAFGLALQGEEKTATPPTEHNDPTSSNLGQQGVGNSSSATSTAGRISSTMQEVAAPTTTTAASLETLSCSIDLTAVQVSSPPSDLDAEYPASSSPGCAGLIYVVRAPLAASSWSSSISSCQLMPTSVNDSAWLEIRANDGLTLFARLLPTLADGIFDHTNRLTLFDQSRQTIIVDAPSFVELDNRVVGLTLVFDPSRSDDMARATFLLGCSDQPTDNPAGFGGELQIYWVS